MADDPADIDLNKSVSEEPRTDTSRSRVILAVVSILGVILALGFGYLSLRRSDAPAASTTTAKPSAPAAPATTEEQIPLPALDQTDTLVRDLVGKLSSHPAVAAWLTTDGLIVNFVLVTNKIAKGETPASDLKPVGPVPRFAPKKSKELLYLDRSSYRRYDRYAEAVSTLDARGTARLYRILKPRMQDAYRRVSPTGDQFDPVMDRAISELLAVPIVEGDLELVPKGIVYGFADERLQKLSAAQKQLLRMGPENVRKIQSKLEEIRSALR